MIAKETYSADHQLLSSETWTYDAFHLLSHIHPNGLVEIYTYDCFGRKIKETAEDRLTLMTYDPLWFIEKIQKGETSHVEIHDVGGRVVKQWDEDEQGTIENLIQFFYNGENRKEKALRLTAQGESTDLFEYDGEGRLSRHTDPYGAQTQFIYSDETINDLGQRIRQNVLIDPLGNVTCETFDASNRVILCEKKDPQGAVVAKEKWLYDRSGNTSHRISTVYNKNQPSKTITTSWEYDLRGRVVKEVEAGKKITFNAYDANGRLVHQTQPNGVSLSWTFDGIDRLLELKSSDQTVHYKYTYDLGLDPIQIDDLIQHKTLNRSYNRFREVVQETHLDGFLLRWEYDDTGRCTGLTLPDQSSIHYSYDGAHLVRVEKFSSSRKLQYQHEYTQFDVNGHVLEEKMIYNLGVIDTHRDLMERPKLQTSPWADHALDYGPSGLIIEAKNSLFGTKLYQYDALNQLLQEGDREYHFDSLGNPTDLEVNDLNQLVATSEGPIIYDLNGNPTQQADVQYTYDALGRLTTISHPQKRYVTFIYDPLSRLSSKTSYSYQNNRWVEESTVCFFYDQEKEIGVLNQEGDLLQLKVLGLGIKEDRGAAIALELHGTIYAPLHDFNGNIIGLINPAGELAEIYNIDAFGLEFTSPAQPINPWRFCSKRAEEGLIFFGKRFYNPAWGRWLTPDPIGFLDSPNLYLYVQNNPLNRLDLFGLITEQLNPIPVSIEVSYQALQQQIANGKTFVYGRGICNEVHMDLLIRCSVLIQLNFTQETLKTDIIKVEDYLFQLVPKEGAIVGITTFQNGIRTSWKEFEQMCESTVEKLPANNLFIGIYNPTEGFLEDLDRVKVLRLGALHTPQVCSVRQVMNAIAENIHKINPELIWHSITHSEAGGVEVAAIKGMTPDQQALLKHHLAVSSYGSIRPMPKKYALIVNNYYSEKDHAAKGFAAVFDPSQYNIHFLPCVSKLSERSMFCFDHAYMGQTYQRGCRTSITYMEDNYGHYNVQKR